jgi:hypothetical protein
VGEVKYRQFTLINDSFAEQVGLLVSFFYLLLIY